MVTEALLRDAWLRAEAQCECRETSHFHGAPCTQFLLWAERGGTGKGAWEVRERGDRRQPGCQILCAACYALITGTVPKGR